MSGGLDDKQVVWHTEQWNAFNDDCCLLFLSRKDVYLLGQALLQMTWETRWIVGEGDELPDIDALSSELNVKLMTCDALQYREKPTDNCVLQYTTDGGNTWVDAFDFSSCIKSQVKPIVDAKGDEILDKLLDDYNTGGESAISDDLTYGDADDDKRDYALCLAIEIMIDALCDAEIARQDAGNEIYENFGDTLQGIAVVLLGLPIPGSRWLAMLAALGSWLVRTGYPIFAAVNLAALSSEEARELVACTMYDALKGDTPSFSRWQASLDNPKYSPISYAAAIGYAISFALPELEIYVAFLKEWAELIPYALGGFLDTCSCPDLGWTVSFLNGSGVPPNWIAVDNNPFDDATYDAPNDWFQALDTASQSESSAFCTIEFDIAGDCDIEWIYFDIDLINPAGGTNPSGQGFWLYDNVDALIGSQTIPGYHKNNTPARITWEADKTGVQTIRLQARCYEPTNGLTVEAQMLEIRIHGTGTIPPEWAAYEV